MRYYTISARRKSAERNDTMFSETVEIYDFVLFREVIIPYPQSAQVGSRYDTMFSETVEIFDFVLFREVIIP